MDTGLAVISIIRLYDLNSLHDGILNFIEFWTFIIDYIYFLFFYVRLSYFYFLEFVNE